MDIRDKIVNRKSYRQAINLVYPTSKNSNRNFNTLTYTRKITDLVSKQLSKRGLNKAIRTNNKLSNAIKNNKNKTNKRTKSGIYQLNRKSRFNDNFKIFHNERKSKKLIFQEGMELNRYKKSDILLNQQLEINTSPLIYIKKHPIKCTWKEIMFII